MKKIEDYLHLYIGCDIEFGFEGHKKIGTLYGVHHPFGYQVFDPSSPVVPIKAVRPELIKLILRPLSDMTKEEMEECGNMIYDFSDDPELNTWEWQYFQIGLAPEQLYYLLKNGFDLFNLIPEGLAIDKTRIKQQQ